MSERLSVSSLWNLVQRPVLLFEAALLAALLLLVRTRASLGLPVQGAGVEQLLTLGAILVVASHMVWLVWGLAREAGASKLGTTTWPFFLLPLILYLAILPWSTARRGLDGDEPFYLLIAHSLAYDFDTELTNNYAHRDSLRFSDRALEPSWADPVRPDGKTYSRHSPGLPLLLAPGYRVAGKRGAVVTMALMTALASWLAWRLALRYWPEHEPQVVWAWALLALTPPLLLYSHQLWVEVPAMILLLVALDQIRSLQDGSSTTRRPWFILTTVVVLLPLLKLRFLLLAAPLLLLSWWRSGRSKRTLVGAMGGLAVFSAGLLALNRWTTGKWLRDHSLDQMLDIQASHPLEYLQGATGLLWDCAFGLFAANPAWLLLIPALLLVIWQRKPIALDLLVLGLPYLAVVAPRREWYGAWSPPFRFGLVFLPLIAMALVPLLTRMERLGARAITTMSLALGAAFSLLWLAEPGWTYNLATGTNHLLDHLGTMWGADAARFFPSQVRPRTASWLVPLVLGTAVLVFWWWPRRRSGWPVAAIASLLLALAAIPLAAHRVPTRVIELEDRHVAKVGGDLFPEAWVPHRPRFRGGWQLTRCDSIRAPVVAGGESVTVSIELSPAARSTASVSVSISAGDAELAVAGVDSGRGWQTLVVEHLEWAGGEPLVLALEPSGPPTSPDLAVIFDRVLLSWD